MNKTTNKVSRTAIWVMGGVLLLALIIPFIAKAGVRVLVQPYTATSLTNVPTSIAASSASANTEIVDCRRVTDVAIQVTGQLTATNPAAATLTIPVYRSIDGTTFESTAFTSLILTFTGTQSKTFSTNLNIRPFGYIQIGGYTSTATNIATNLTVKVSGKPDWNVFVGPDYSNP